MPFYSQSEDIYLIASAKFDCPKCGERLVLLVDSRFFNRGQPIKCDNCDHQMKAHRL